MGDTKVRTKLIEVSIPLDAINAASVKEKSIRHGHPSTLHLWWARRPLAACRAVLFAQLVDDPSAWPDRFPTPEAVETERNRLHNLIAAMVPWEASNNVEVLNKGRWEIARSVAWDRGEEPPPFSDPNAVLDYLQAYAPPVYDPFCGGGSIPLEAQRLGLRAIGSDLNPVAVLISKALIELPPKFANWQPVHPEARVARLVDRTWTGTRGLAEDVRCYGRWMRQQAEQRIGHLYPKARLQSGSEATVIAWLWARTVRSPDPAARGAHVPLTSTFMLSTKPGKQAWVEPVVDRLAGRYRFEVRTGTPTAGEAERAAAGTQTARGANFTCLLTGSPISGEWIKAECMANRAGARLLAMVVETGRSRTYLPPTEAHEVGNKLEQLESSHDIVHPIADDPRAITCTLYGLNSFDKLFTPRQLIALTTFSDLVREARALALADALAAGVPDDGAPLHTGGTGAVAYADAVATYLAFALSKAADRNTTLCSWETKMDRMRNTFGRQAIPMIWDYTETNPLGGAGGDIAGTASSLAEVLDRLTPGEAGEAIQVNATDGHYTVHPALISTDPPYYDNIGYADLSDFFYVWLRKSLSITDSESVWPNLFRNLLTPKAEELTATAYRHGGKGNADIFFMRGMGHALRAMAGEAHNSLPLTIYYAFKQSEIATDGIVSPGWTSFLQAVVDSGLSIDGTWPLRTELGNRMRGVASNALASSIVLVCRKRSHLAPVVEREEFVRALRRELPDGLAQIRAGGVGPVDMAQAAIGPGMGVFTRYAAVLEDSGNAMKVRTALALINQTRDEIDNEDDSSYDLETRFALDWFTEAGWDVKESGRAILAANARNLSLDGLIHTGLISAQGGRTRLIRRDEMPANYDPALDNAPIVWKAAQHLARALTAEDGGQDRAAAIMVRMSGREAVRALAYRLYGLCERKNWAAEALVWNRVAEEWRAIEDRSAIMPRAADGMPDLFEVAR